MSSEVFDSVPDMVFVWEVVAYDWKRHVLASGAGATALEAKLDCMRDIPACLVARIAWVECERVLVGMK